MRLYDCATTIRSKNAGPFTLTIDLMFADEQAMDRVIVSARFTAENVAALYGVAASSVRICPVKSIRAIKVSMPRSDGSSGSSTDRDVYGCQQHFPLAEMEI